MAVGREESVTWRSWQAEHYKEMVEYMEKVIGAMGEGEELMMEECNLLSVTYKNVIAALHVSWRIVSFIKQKEGRRNHNHVVAIRGYRARVKSKLDSIYGGILRLLDAHLILVAAAIDSKVF